MDMASHSSSITPRFGRPISYLRLTRPDHWFKNLFLLPGAFFAALLLHAKPGAFALRLAVAFCAACFTASANYVINEWLDAEFDRFHPIKRYRESVTHRLDGRMIWTLYAGLAALGLWVASWVSVRFVLPIAVLLVMGILYNVRPFRTKERVYLDVVSESFNNAIRLFLGWVAVSPDTLPPASLVLAYWAGGAYLMALKRFAEYRAIGDPKVAASYRRSFQRYDANRLLVSACFYGLCSAFFLGIFLIKYRMEMILAVPCLAGLFAWYLHLALQPDSAAQAPEALLRQRRFLLYVAAVTIVIFVIASVDIPSLHWLSRTEPIRW